MKCSRVDKVGKLADILAKQVTETDIIIAGNKFDKAIIIDVLSVYCKKGVEDAIVLARAIYSTEKQALKKYLSDRRVILEAFIKKYMKKLRKSYAVNKTDYYSPKILQAHELITKL